MSLTAASGEPSSSAEVLPPEKPAERFSKLPPALVQRMFKPGQSGNPGGRSKLELEVRAMARQASPEIMAKLIETALTTDDDRVFVVAAEKILERAYGKPKESVPGDEAPEKDRPDIGKLNDKQRAQLKKLMQLAVGKKDGEA